MNEGDIKPIGLYMLIKCLILCCHTYISAYTYWPGDSVPFDESVIYTMLDVITGGGRLNEDTGVTLTHEAGHWFGLDVSILECQYGDDENAVLTHRASFLLSSTHSKFRTGLLNATPPTRATLLPTLRPCLLQPLISSMTV